LLPPPVAQLTPTGWGYLGGGDNGLGQNAGVRGVAADPCPSGTTKQMLNGDGVTNPGEDPNLLLADFCVPCGPGVHCDPSTSSSPQNCPAGTYGGVIGAKTVSGCIDCPVGTYQDMDGQFECHSCAANTFASAPGATSCQSCGDGYEVSAAGSNMCNPCKPGTYRDSAVSEKCMECPAGTSSGEGELSGHWHQSVTGCVWVSAAASNQAVLPVTSHTLLLPTCPHPPTHTQVPRSATSACPAATPPPSSLPCAQSAHAAPTKTSMARRRARPANRARIRTRVRRPSAKCAPRAPSTQSPALCPSRPASECHHGCCWVACCSLSLGQPQEPASTCSWR
jgi:hypothetical protein